MPWPGCSWQRRLSQRLWLSSPSAEMSGEAFGPGLDGGRGVLVWQHHTIPVLYSSGACASQAEVHDFDREQFIEVFLLSPRARLLSFFFSQPL